MNDGLSGAWLPHRYSLERLEEYEERRAILEADGMPSFDADFAARKICLDRWKAVREGKE